MKDSFRFSSDEFIKAPWRHAVFLLLFVLVIASSIGFSSSLIIMSLSLPSFSLSSLSLPLPLSQFLPRSCFSYSFFFAKECEECRTGMSSALIYSKMSCNSLKVRACTRFLIIHFLVCVNTDWGPSSASASLFSPASSPADTGDGRANQHGRLPELWWANGPTTVDSCSMAAVSLLLPVELLHPRLPAQRAALYALRLHACH